MSQPIHSVDRSSRYRLVGLIARGGMGEVFEAAMTGPGGFEKPVVIKRILPQLVGDLEATRRFVGEARLMSRLAHPNIVSVLDFGGGDEGDHFLVLELVRGMDLHALQKALAARSRPMPVPLAVFIATQVLRGLHSAHTSVEGGGATLVHRDVSPHNVLVSRIGEVKVADFGVAAIVGASGAGRSDVGGKPRYMAPEQFDGCEVDARADVFSTGVLLFQTLTGELPFAGADDLLSYRQAILDGERRSASGLRADLPAALDRAIAIALEVDPARRYPSARAMETALLEAMGPERAGPDELAELLAGVLHDAPVPMPVRRLGGGAAPTAELTRVDGQARFTLVGGGGETKVTFASLLGPGSDDHATPPTERIERDESPSPSPPADQRRRGAARWAIGAALAALGMAAAYAWWLRGPSEADLVPEPAHEEIHSVSVSAESDPVNPDNESLNAENAPPPAETASAETPPSPTPVAPPPPPLASAALAASPAIAATPPKTETGCRGEVHLYAGHGWIVSGGPTVVEAPGRHTVPCGTYGLVARSRVDDQVTRSRVVVVQAGQPVAWDLR